eukprot:scaffold442_cov268-Pinguiococcus_pyrenoidosus.AAC.50
MRTPLLSETSLSETFVVRPRRSPAVKPSAQSRTQLTTFRGSTPGRLIRASSGPTSRSISSSHVTKPPLDANESSTASRARSVPVSGGGYSLDDTRLREAFAAAGQVPNMDWNTASVAASADVSPSPSSPARSTIPSAMAPLHDWKSDASAAPPPAGHPGTSFEGSTSLPIL